MFISVDRYTPKVRRLRLLILYLGLSQFRVLRSNPPKPFSGPFSSIDLPELQDLAARAAGMIEKYGERRVEKVFEQQLALLMQSLGFYVVRTRTGRRRVDLVCISSDPNHQYSVLVEAKSTHRPYALPTSDQRALSEYADDVRRTLVTLPPLRLVFLVGPSGASTLEAKLNLLEGNLGTPVRFLTATQLALLRDLVPGHAPAAAFRDLAVGARTRVLTDDFARSVAEAFTRGQEAHAQFVEALLMSQPVFAPPAGRVGARRSV